MADSESGQKEDKPEAPALDVPGETRISLTSDSLLENNIFNSTVLVKSFAHLIGIFYLASLEEIGKLWKWWTVYSGVLQLTDFWGMIICDGF